MVHSHHCNATNQNIALTIIQDSQIIANQMAAFLMIFSPVSYFLLSHHDVSIRNHAYNTKHKEIVANIHKTQFMAVCIV